jgi:hypothetical protein
MSIFLFQNFLLFIPLLVPLLSLTGAVLRCCCVCRTSSSSVPTTTENVRVDVVDVEAQRGSQTARTVWYNQLFDFRSGFGREEESRTTIVTAANATPAE